jgi:hypothetical protein
MGVVPAAVVVAPSAVDVPLAEADARRSAVAVIRSGRRLPATRRLAAVMPTAIKAAVPATVTVRAMGTVTASLVTRRDMTRGADRVMTRGARPAIVAGTLTAAATATTPDVAVMATLVPAVSRTVTPTVVAAPQAVAPARTKLTLTSAVASSLFARS